MASVSLKVFDGTNAQSVPNDELRYLDSHTVEKCEVIQCVHAKKVEAETLDDLLNLATERKITTRQLSLVAHEFPEHLHDHQSVTLAVILIKATDLSHFPLLLHALKTSRNDSTRAQILEGLCYRWGVQGPLRDDVLKELSETHTKMPLFRVSALGVAGDLAASDPHDFELRKCIKENYENAADTMIETAAEEAMLVADLL